MTVAPALATLPPGGTQQFTARVTGTTIAAVEWRVNGIPGGDATVGTVTAAGFYSAPLSRPAGALAVSVTAVSTVDARRSGAAAVNVEADNPVPVITAVLAPSTITSTQTSFTLTVFGSNFVAGAAVEWNGAARATTFASDTRLEAAIATGELASGSAAEITAVNPAPGGGVSNSVSFPYKPPPGVSPVPTLSGVAPSEVDADTAATLTVTGTGFVASSKVTFAGAPLTTSLVSAAALNATLPKSQTALAGTYLIRVSNPQPGGGVSDPANVTVNIRVTISPATPTLALNQTRHFTATVHGTADQTVSWQVNGVAGGEATNGTVSAGGIYITPNVLPETVGGTNPVTLAAVSAADPTRPGTTPITVIIPPSDNYPRAGAGSVLASAPPLPQIPTTGAQVAVLDWRSKDPDATEEELLAIDHVLNVFAIPHVHVATVAEASGYRFLLVAGTLETSALLPTSDRNALRNYAQSGGTVLLWRPSEPNLLSLLGISSTTAYSGVVVRPLTFATATGDPALTYIDDPAEVNWELNYIQNSTTRGYDAGTNTVLATWDGKSSDTAAVVRVDKGSGRFYVFGWRLRTIVTVAERQIFPGVEVHDTNIFFPGADICRLLVRGIYEGWASGAPPERVFAPEGKRAALIMTHDVDAASSYSLTPEFAQWEHDQGLTATYNFTTSPFNTGWVGTLYDTTSMADVQTALDLGMDVESHSVGHFVDFDHAPFGTGSETAENYFPRYSFDLSATIGSSVIGDLGVSRWLLQQDFGVPVEGFRSGYLFIPSGFLDGLAMVGYHRDSTYAGVLTQGAFPFVPFKVNSGVVTTYPLMEYPIVLSDDGLDDTNFDAWIDNWESIIRSNYANNAPTVILIHNSSSPLRLQAEQAILPRVADLNLWVGDWTTFAHFWEAQGVTCSRWP